VPVTTAASYSTFGLRRSGSWIAFSAPFAPTTSVAYTEPGVDRALGELADDARDVRLRGLHVGEDPVALEDRERRQYLPGVAAHRDVLGPIASLMPGFATSSTDLTRLDAAGTASHEAVGGEGHRQPDLALGVQLVGQGGVGGGETVDLAAGAYLRGKLVGAREREPDACRLERVPVGREDVAQRRVRGGRSSCGVLRRPSRPRPRSRRRPARRRSQPRSWPGRRGASSALDHDRGC